MLRLLVEWHHLVVPHKAQKAKVLRTIKWPHSAIDLNFCFRKSQMKTIYVRRTMMVMILLSFGGAACGWVAWSATDENWHGWRSSTLNCKWKWKWVRPLRSWYRVGKCPNAMLDADRASIQMSVHMRLRHEWGDVLLYHYAVCHRTTWHLLNFGLLINRSWYNNGKRVFVFVCQRVSLPLRLPSA